MKRPLFPAALVLPLLLSGAVCQPPVHQVSLGGFVLRFEQESSRRVGRTDFEYVFRGSLESPGGSANARSALVTSRNAATAVVDDDLEFPAIDGLAASVASLDTFSVRHDRRSPFDPSQLLFQLDPPSRGLLSSDPAPGASDVPVTAWLRLAFGSPVDDALLASLALRCGGIARPFLAGSVSAGLLAVNPDADLPPESACVLDFAGPDGAAALSFETAELGADLPSVIYDRTDLGLTAPFPDDVWTEPDATQPTGLRLAIPTLEREPDVVNVFEALRIATPAFDGFSPLGGIVIQLDAAPDPRSVPADQAESVDPLASIGLFDLSPGSPSFGARVPFSATVGADVVRGRPPDHSIVLFPGIPLRAGGRYGLVVTRRLLASPSRPFAPSEFSVAALGPPGPGEPDVEPDALVRARELSGEVLAALGATSAVPFGPDDVALVLRITVHNTDDIYDDISTMKQQVLARPPPAFEILTVQPGFGTSAAVVSGEWTAPEWRQGKFLARTAAGLPRIVTTRRLGFTLALPREALSGPVPLVMYQHGSPGGAASEVPGNHLTKAGFAVAGFTDPLNRENNSDPDLFTQAIFGNLLFGKRAPEYEAQLYGEQLAFLRMLPSLGSIDVLPLGAPDGVPEIDGSAPLGYHGISQGAVHGEAFLAYAPEIRAAALVVGGNRTTENYYHQARVSPIGATPLLHALVGLIANATPTDVWVGLSLYQLLADRQDPHLQARRIYRDPIEVAGTTRKASILFIEGLEDSFITNNASRSLAFTAGPVPQVDPVVQRSILLPVASTPLRANLDEHTTSGFVQYAPADNEQGLPVSPGCEFQSEGHYCAQVAPGSRYQQAVFLRSALLGPAPVIVDPFADRNGDGESDADEYRRGNGPPILPALP